MNAASWLEKIPPSQQWRALALAHGPRIATWVLALALGVQAATIVTDLAGGGQRKTETQGRLATPGITARRGVDVAAITNGHLFGSAPDPAAQGATGSAPQTSMTLVLTGIIAGADPNTGFAILGENPTAAKVHAVGDRIPGGAKLHSVYSDRVLLERNGALESLALPRQLTAVSGPPPQPMADANAAADHMRKLIADDPSIVGDVMRNQPVLADGKLRGFRVYPGRNHQAFVRLGLRPGDLVVAINGTPLDDPARGQEIFRTMGASSEAHVTVMRNGRQQDLTMNLAQVAQEADQLAGPQPQGGTPAGMPALPDQVPPTPPTPESE